MIIKDDTIIINGHSLLLRCALEEDAEALLEYLKTVFGETRYMVKEPEEITMTPEEERRFINSQRESPHELLVLGFLDGDYVGNCSLMGKKPDRYRHRASIGIALFQKYTGMGIGRAMLEKLISIAKEKGLEQLELEVVSSNKPAVSLYQKLGFKICGTLPKNMKYKDGTYADAYFMIKEL